MFLSKKFVKELFSVLRENTEERKEVTFRKSEVPISSQESSWRDFVAVIFFRAKSEGRRPIRCKMGHDTSSKQHNLSR